MSTKTTTQIYEEIREDLLSEAQDFSVTVADRGGDLYWAEQATKLNNPFDIDYERFVPADRPMDFPRFIEVAKQLIADAQKREGVDEAKYVQLIEDYPGENFDRFLGGEVITWRLISREPARMSTKGTTRPQRKSLFSHDLRRPEFPNTVISVSNRPLDHIVEFSIWSKDAGKANRRALWLERLFIAHTWAFKIQGAERFYFEKRLADNYRTTGGQSLYERPLRFSVRLIEFEVRAYPKISHIEFKVSLDPGSSD